MRAKFRSKSKGDRVTLRGTVGSWAERDEAERIAWRMPGVAWVDNQLAVERGLLLRRYRLHGQHTLTHRLVPCFIACVMIFHLFRIPSRADAKGETPT